METEIREVYRIRMVNKDGHVWFYSTRNGKDSWGVAQVKGVLSRYSDELEGYYEGRFQIVKYVETVQIKEEVVEFCDHYLKRKLLSPKS